MKKWKCVYTTNTNKYTFTVGKIYESDDKGYGIKGDDGFIFDFTTALLSESLISGHGFVVTRFEEVVVEEITQFGKSDLQECDIVVLRNGERYILFDRMFISNIRSNISLNKYAENLKYNASYMSNADIMQVNRNNQPIFSRVEPTERELQIKQLQDEMDKIKVKLEELR